ncbi:MAG: hypothetical protein ACM3TR_14975 [Caulobacteraceae bacterium]
MKKKTAIIAMALTAVLTLSACQATDIIAKTSVTSFEALTDKLGDKISFAKGNDAWAITSPTGERFLIAKDFTGNADTMQEFDAQPFLNAGLDPAKLPSETYKYNQTADKLIVIGELSSDKFSYNGNPTIVDTYKELIRTNRKSLAYHLSLDHYGIALGNGNVFEWAKDMSTNDKDMVFVLNPEPFISAGVDPSKVKGWAFAKVKVMDENGKQIEVDKLLKPFELN